MSTMIRHTYIDGKSVRLTRDGDVWQVLIAMKADDGHRYELIAHEGTDRDQADVAYTRALRTTVIG